MATCFYESAAMFVVLFDLEGTLVRSLESNPEAVQEFRAKTRERIVDLGVPPVVLEGLVRSTYMRNAASDYVADHFGKAEAEEFQSEMDEFMRGYELRWAGLSEVHDDSLPALRELRDKGYRMGLVTNTSTEAAEMMLSSHGLREFFQVVVARDDVARLKPDPEGLLLARRGLGASEFVYVGDLVFDSMAAEAAGVVSVIVNRGGGELTFEADFVVASLREIHAVVAGLER